MLLKGRLAPRDLVYVSRSEKKRVIESCFTSFSTDDQVIFIQLLADMKLNNNNGHVSNNSLYKILLYLIFCHVHTDKDLMLTVQCETM